MNKTQLIEAISLEANMSKIEVRKAVEALICVTKQVLHEGDKLVIPGFGTFCVQQKAARVGRNPRTGAPVKVPSRKVVKFRPAIEVE